VTFAPDPDQQRILEHVSGPMLVTGPAGTGKTTALFERFVRLLDDGADPERMVIVVRSRRDRDDIRARLLARVDRPLPSLLVLTTQGLAFHVVSARFRELGYGEPPQILSAGDQLTKVQELLRGEDPEQWHAYGSLLGLRGFAEQVRDFLRRAQEALVTPTDIVTKADAAGLTGWHELAAFYGQYLDVLGSMNAVDFAGLVWQASRALETADPMFDHVLADDYQDTTIGGDALVLGLGAQDVVVAGDPDRHVFSFQGTTDVPLRTFVDRMPKTTEVELPRRHRGDAVSLVAWCTRHTSEEHAGAARELRRIHVEEDVPWGDLAVVVRRQGSHLAALLRALDDAGVPRHVAEGGLSLTSEPAVWPYVLALRWVARPLERDQIAESVLTSELGGISPASARGLLRNARTMGRAAHEAITETGTLTPAEIASLEQLRAALAEAEGVKANALDAFSALWRGLPYSARLVARADDARSGRGDLDAVVALSNVAALAGSSADPSLDAFVGALETGGTGTSFVGAAEATPDAVRVLTAHAAAGQEFDTVVVVGAVEGDFPSLTRPEPMFDLGALERRISRSERNRARLEDERRLFGMVLERARRRVVLTASDPHGEEAVESARSRFVDERHVAWTIAPAGPFDEPVSVAEAAAAWRRRLADPSAPPPERLASIDGLLALGVEPSRWWFQNDWTDTGAPLHETLRLSFSRLDRLENCELQFVLGEELGLGRRGGHQAGVGKIVHELIERCERGEIARTLEALVAALNARWDPKAFPSLAVSEAFRLLAIEKMLPNWVEHFGGSPAIASEVEFSFEFEGATIVGVIDRIGRLENGGTRITDFKTGKADKAPKAEESLQLGVYYLAVTQDEELAEYRPVRAVDLAYLRGHWRTGEIVDPSWPISETGGEAYQQAVREHLVELIDHIRKLEATEVYRPNPYANCYFCDFKSLCPLYPEGQPLFAIAEVTA
jgi:superfamily I DNA/RNA helicase/RecB family exonuclease